MPLRDLTVEERQVIHECLKASVEGPFFDDWEFDTLFGVRRKAVEQVLASWPDVAEDDQVVTLAINNALNNLLGYPHGREDAWKQFISVSPKEVGRIFAKWRGESVSGYFDGMR